MGAPRRHATLHNKRAGIGSKVTGASAETRHQRLIGHEDVRDIARWDALGRAARHGAATTPEFQTVRRTQPRNYLGQMIARIAELGGMIGGHGRAVQCIQRSHQQSQPAIGERGEAHGRDLDLVFIMRIGAF